MDVQVDVEPAACIFLALLFLTIPAPWIISAATAASIHELAHIGAVCAAGGRIYSVRIRSHGAVIESSQLTSGWELVCVLAGPMASLLLGCTVCLIPKIALCSMVQGLFNLIPVLPLDGGRALYCMTKMIFSPETGEKVCNTIEMIVFILIIAAAFWLFFTLGWGVGVFWGILLLLSRTIAGKIPCKDRRFAVQ